LIDSFDDEFVGYVRPEDRPENYREVCLAVVEKLKN